MDLPRTRVLVVDDSAFMRKVITDLISQDPALEVIGTARDGLDALEKVEKLSPDVITLDVEMPRQNGLETLRQLMRRRPLPVVMLSSLTQAGARATVEALSLGAVDFVTKPSGAISLDIEKVKDELIQKIKTAALARLKQESHRDIPTGGGGRRGHSLRLSRQGGEIQSSSAGYPRALDRPEARLTVVIGASTGGPRALEIVIRQLPADLPAGVLVVQHMPAGFTRSLAERLNQLAAITVKEAEAGNAIQEGVVLLAPGDFHMKVGSDYRIHLDKSPPVNYVRPSVDVTMLSLPAVFHNRLIGVILTGMGKDGAEGMASIKQAGGITIAQDEASSTIYGMPRVVAENGDADFILPVEYIGEAVVKAVTTLRQRVR